MFSRKLFSICCYVVVWPRLCLHDPRVRALLTLRG